MLHVPYHNTLTLLKKTLFCVRTRGMRWLVMVLLAAFQSVSLSARELVLYYSPTCFYSKKVIRYIENHDITLERKDITNNPQARSELKEQGGKLVVPCLFVDRVAIYESDDIIEWLAENALGKRKP